MGPRHRYISDPDLALMPSPQPHWDVFVGVYEVQVPLLQLFPPLMFLSHAFKDHVGFGRLFEGYHLKGGGLLKLNRFGKKSLADFALKLRKIV